MRTAGKFDVALSPSSIPLAFLEYDAPKVIWADATFHSLRVSYPGFSRYCLESIKSGDKVEQIAYERSALLCYASEWAANDAIDYYGVPRHKVRVIPFGANCDSPFSSEEHALAHIRQRAFSTNHFVFIGVDWERKGGDLAVEIIRRLNEVGAKSHLSIIGCRPALSATDASFVKCLGFLSKSDAGDVARLQNTLMQSHFLLVPTSAE
jgi:glycosyltransferase involved in cell wall biosynthesis